MSPPARQTDEASFETLLAAYDEAVAGGRGGDFLKESAIPEDLLPRLQRARPCLEMLAALWPDPSEGTSPAPQAGGMSEPVRIGRFVVERELGRGGFGIVYLAYDPRLKRPVALKIPRLEALWTAELRERFLREAEITAGLEHPHIVPVYEAGETGPLCWIASLYCPGVNLTQWLVEHPDALSPRQAATLVATLAEALHHCHSRGILHRDLKPSNIMLVPIGDVAAATSIDELPFVPRLTDFGLAKLVETSLAETRSSVILGTPLYMAPEQAEGRWHEIGPATDIYALGAILYEILAGRPPFPGATLLEVLDRVRAEEPVRPSRLRPGQPRDLETICLKCLHKEPSRRYASAVDLADDLRRFLRHEPIEARSTGIFGRLRAWSLRPERINEAATVAVLNGMVGALGATGLIAGILAGLIVVPHPRETVQEAVTKGHVFYGLIWWLLAWHTFARRGWAIWVGAIGTPMLFIWATASMLNWIPMGDLFAGRDPAMLLLVQLTSVALLLTQAALYLAALRAYYRNAPIRRSGTTAY